MVCNICNKIKDFYFSNKYIDENNKQLKVCNNCDITLINLRSYCNNCNTLKFLPYNDISNRYILKKISSGFYYNCKCTIKNIKNLVENTQFEYSDLWELLSYLKRKI